MLTLLLAFQAAAAPHDALRYDVTLVPSDTGSHLLGEVETTWRLATADPVTVQLDSSMRVVRVLIDGRPNPRLSRTMYGRSEDDLLVPHQKRAGDSITTRVRYHGFARVGARVGKNGQGEPSFYASGAGARYWLPVPESTALEYTLAGFRIQAPVSHRAIAPGRLIRVDTLPYGDAAWVYRLDVPVPIASLSVATGPYRVRALAGSCGAGCSGVELWSYGTGPGEPGGFERASSLVEFMAARVGPYPFGRLAHVEAPVDQVVDGPGMIFYPEGSLAGGGPAPSALGQAAARQWFGVAVVPASPQEGWITQGLARYLQELWSDPSGQGFAAPDSTGPEPDLLTARRLQQLRTAVGDSAFFGGLRRVVELHRERPVTHASLMRAMSEVAGRELELTRP
jgi:aminopeptidase N